MAETAPYRVTRIETLPGAGPVFGGHNPPTPETPLGAAVLWAICVLNLPGTASGFADITVDPRQWPQPRQYAALIDGRVLACRPRYGPRPGVAFVKVLPAGIQVDPAPTRKILGNDDVIVVRRCPDSWWRVVRAAIAQV